MAHVDLVQVRLTELFNWLKTNKKLRQKDVARMMGTSETSVSRNIRAAGDGRANVDFLVQLNNAFDGIFNIDYILNGTGELLSSKDDDIKTATDKAVDEETEETLPLIPIEAIGGALTGTDGQWMEYECDRYVVPAFKKSDFLIRVDGDSMYPKYCRGDIVACTKVPLTDLWFQWGRTYVVDTRQGALIKYLEPGKDEGHITLASENPKYKPFQLPVTEINGVALVNGLIRVE